MKLYNISLFSIKRQKGKKVFLLIALVIGCATVIALFTFISAQKNKIENQFDEFGANIIVMPKSDNLSLSYGGINVSGVTANLEEMQLTDIQKIWQIPNKQNIRSVSPKILGAVNVINKEIEKNALMVGVYFEEEKKIKSWWEMQGKYPENKDEIIVGFEVGKKLGLNVGDSIKVKDNFLKVTALLFPTGSQDDNIIFADYDYVSELLNKKGSVSLVEVSALCADCPIDTIIGQISVTLPAADIKGVKQIMKQKMDTLAQFEKFAFTITFVIILIGAILIFTSMMGGVAERKHEIGIFRAIGFKKKHIITIILTESLILSIIAGFIGIITGYGISFFLLPILTEINISMLSLNPVLIISTIIAVILLGFIAAIYPAYSAAEVDPVKTLNSI